MKKNIFLFKIKILGLYINLLSRFCPKIATSITYQLFSNPKYGKLKKNKLPAILQESIQEVFEYKREKFQSYIWKGNEEAILLVHGWESNASRWKKLINHLKKTENTIIALDAPAHGLSEGNEFNTPKYTAFIKHISQKFQPKTIIGHSLGGMAIIDYLNNHKDTSVEKVVLLGVPSELKILINNFTSLLGLNRFAITLFENYFIDNFKIHPNDYSSHNFAKNLNQKALIAHDIDDKEVSTEESYKIYSAWKNSIYIETKGLGHALHGKDLYQEIVSFVSTK